MQKKASFSAERLQSKRESCSSPATSHRESHPSPTPLVRSARFSPPTANPMHRWNCPSRSCTKGRGWMAAKRGNGKGKGSLLHRFPCPQTEASAQKGAQRVIRCPFRTAVASCSKLQDICILVRILPAGRRVGFPLSEWLSRTELWGVDAIENCAVLVVESA